MKTPSQRSQEPCTKKRQKREKHQTKYPKLLARAGRSGSWYERDPERRTTHGRRLHAARRFDSDLAFRSRGCRRIITLPNLLCRRSTRGSLRDRRRGYARKCRWSTAHCLRRFRHHLAARRRILLSSRAPNSARGRRARGLHPRWRRGRTS